MNNPLTEIEIVAAEMMFRGENGLPISARDALAWGERITEYAGILQGAAPQPDVVRRWAIGRFIGLDRRDVAPPLEGSPYV